MDDWKSKLSNLLPDLPSGTLSPSDTSDKSDPSDPSDPSDNSDKSDKSDLSATSRNPGSKKKHPRLDIILDRKRAGKTATIIAGFDDTADIKEIAQIIKQRLGTGGSARGGEILIQGDRRSDIAQILASLGFTSRLI